MDARNSSCWADLVPGLLCAELHNDYGDAREAANKVQHVFGTKIGALASTLVDLEANFDGPNAQGTRAYVNQITLDHPEIDVGEAAADCQLAVEIFCNALLSTGSLMG